VALEPSAGVRVWLPNEVLAVRDLAVVWLDRGVNVQTPELQSDMPTTVIY
jgi:hypothetical protein